MSKCNRNVWTALSPCIVIRISSYGFTRHVPFGLWNRHEAMILLAASFIAPLRILKSYSPGFNSQSVLGSLMIVVISCPTLGKVKHFLLFLPLDQNQILTIAFVPQHLLLLTLVFGVNTGSFSAPAVSPTPILAMI